MIDKRGSRGLLVVGLALIGMLLMIAGQALSEVPSITEFWKVSPEDRASVQKEKWLFGVATRSLYLDYFLAMQKSVVERCYEWGIEAVTADAMLDPQLQLDQIDRFITMGVDAVILNAQDPRAILPAVKRLNEAGIPVITLDIELVGEKVDLHISFDNVLGGDKCGEALVGMLEKRYGKPKGLVLEIMGDPRHIVVPQRSEGFHNWVDKYPDIEVMQKVGYWSADEAFKITQDILTAYGSELDALYFHSDCMATGAVEGIKASGYEVPQGDPERIFVVGMDGFPSALQLMRKGRIDFLDLQPVNYYGYLAVDWMIKILRGEIAPSSGLINVPDEVWCPAYFSETRYKTGPQLLTYSVSIGTEVPLDDIRLWGNWLKQ